MLSSTDVVIIGGGLMGSSVAYHLRRADQSLRVAVVEPDSTYARASSSLSMANVRLQFSLRENILISRHTMEVLETFGRDMEVNGDAPDVAFRREGNLFLVPHERRRQAREAFELQRQLGCAVQWWEHDDIERRYPLYRPRGWAGATFGPQDGHLDAHAFLTGYGRKARALGAVFLEDEVVQVRTAARRVTGVSLRSGGAIEAGVVVNCAGAWAARVAGTAGVGLPVAPTVRQVFVLRPQAPLDGPLPLTNLPSGLYFRTETGGLLLAGRSMAEDPVGFHLEWHEQRFVDHLWPELAELAPCFDRLKIERGWAGLYAVNTFDGNALLGEWPELGGFFLANGFSGHGLQQAPAVGRYLSELIRGAPPTLDLGAFSPQRLLSGERLSENGLV